MTRSVVLGCGAYLPARVLTNQELAETVDTSDEWIVERTGIRERRIAAEGENTSDLALAAARAALERASVEAGSVDLVVLATSTPDFTFPATATAVQAELGITEGAAFDVQAVCSGFVYGLSVADNFLKSGQHERALVIGAETFSRIIDWEDRTTCVLFGDGAGALVLDAQPGKGANDDRGILAAKLRSDGRYRDLLHVDGGVSATGTVGHLRMQGREVFRHAVSKISAVMGEVMEEARVSARDIALFVPHQANRRILAGTAKKLGIDESRVMITLDRHGNTSAASIPLALAEADAQGRLKPGDLVLLEAMGGGFTWGAALLRW